MGGHLPARVFAMTHNLRRNGRFRAVRVGMKMGAEQASQKPVREAWSGAVSGLKALQVLFAGPVCFVA